MRNILEGSQRFDGFFSIFLTSGILFIYLFVLSASIQAETQMGESIYKDFCASCHEGGFKGWVTGAPDIEKPSEWDQYRKNGLEMMVKNTIDGTEHMDPKGGCKDCTDEQIESSVKYINSQLVK